MEFKFEVGQKVRVKNPTACWFLKEGTSAVIDKQTRFAGRPEYVITTEDETGDIAAWVVGEQNLVAEDAS